MNEQCKGITKSGNRCRNKVLSEEQYCRIHLRVGGEDSGCSEKVNNTPVEEKVARKDEYRTKPSLAVKAWVAVILFSAALLSLIIKRVKGKR